MSRQVVMGVDPSLRSTGFGFLALEGGKFRFLDCGVIANAAVMSPAECLVAIYRELNERIARHGPVHLAIESTIYVQSYRTAITLGAARGVAILAAAEQGVEVFEYAPRKIKLAVVGRGGAQKGQVGFMVRALLGLERVPESDASDALAVAIAHVQGLIQSSIFSVKR